MQSQTIQNSEEQDLRELLITYKMDAIAYKKETSTILNYKGISDRPRYVSLLHPSERRKSSKVPVKSICIIQ